MKYQNKFFVLVAIVFSFIHCFPVLGSYPKDFQGSVGPEGRLSLYYLKSPLDGGEYFSKKESREYAQTFYKFATCDPEEVKDYAEMKTYFKKPPKNLSNNSHLKVLSDLYRFQECAIPAILQLKKLQQEAENVFNENKFSLQKYGRGKRSKKRSLQTRIRELCNEELLQCMRFYCTYFTKDDYENLIRGGMLDAKNIAFAALRQR